MSPSRLRAFPSTSKVAARRVTSRRLRSVIGSAKNRWMRVCADCPPRQAVVGMLFVASVLFGVMLWTERPAASGDALHRAPGLRHEHSRQVHLTQPALRLVASNPAELSVRDSSTQSQS